MMQWIVGIVHGHGGVTKWLAQIHTAVWGPWTLVLFLGTGLWFTVKSGFFQIRGIRVWWSQTVGSWWKGKNKSQFQSACTALAATIGTGNIVGVATALTAGGPGALFWMWISAGIGMMTAYAETWLGIYYRYRRTDGSWMCGPMVYMERGLGCLALGKLYAALILLVSLGMGSMVQANSLSEAVKPWVEMAGDDAVLPWFVATRDVMKMIVGAVGEAYVGVPGFIVGVVVVIFAGAILTGGISRISHVTERLVPLSAGFYFLFSLAIVLSCWQQLPGIFAAIFREAWKSSAAGGGLAGFLMSSGVRFGLSRGVFSNEAGLGSLAVLHGAAEETTPEKQGMWAMFEVFFDTIVICTLTALVILCVTNWHQPPLGMDGAALTSWCFSQRIGTLGEVFVSGSMVVFAFATIIAWYYLGEQAVEYLMGTSEKVACLPIKKLYLLLYLAAVFFGCMGRVELIWMLSDIWNGLLAFPNLLALWMLSGKVAIRDKVVGFYRKE